MKRSKRLHMPTGPWFIGMVDGLKSRPPGFHFHCRLPQHGKKGKKG
jgi:hypothetical protein